MRIVKRDRTASMIRPRQRLDRGFTLLEVMVGAMLLMIALVGLVPFFLAGLDQSSSVRNRSTATNIARQKMEEIRMLDYREIPSDVTDEGVVTDEGKTYLTARFGGTETVRSVDYLIDYKVEKVLYGTGFLKEVTVEVSWTGPPKVSPASLTTVIHQQYVGPRISKMEIHDPDPQVDPAGTPFGLLPLGSVPNVYCYISSADQALVLNPDNTVKDDVSMILTIVNDIDVTVAKYDVPSTYLWVDETALAAGEEDAVYFKFPVASTDLPDGYLYFQTVVLNEHSEPGNSWQLRFRVENAGPDAPVWQTDEFIFYEGDSSVEMFWTIPADTDIDHYCIERRGKIGLGWGTWTAIDMNVPYVDEFDVNVVSYLDEGLASPQTYQYRIWAVDLDDNYGATADVEVTLPSGETVPVEYPTTPSTEESPDTYNIIIDNETNLIWSLELTTGAYTVLETVGKKAAVSIVNLPEADYHVVATSTKGDVKTYDFNLPDDAGYGAVWTIQ